MDCTYLATAWSSQSAGLKAREEHNLLGLALTWLSRFRVIDERYLQGHLKNPVQPYPVPAVVGRTKEGQDLGHFWSALGIPPRPAFGLTVTIAVDPFDDVEESGPVQSVRVQGTRLDDPMLTGRVLTPDLEPVPGVAVTLVDQDGVTVGTATSDRWGSFGFADVPFSVYTLRLPVDGAADHSRRVVYARDSQVHDVVLPGP
jgi:hypothetical protein